MKLWDKIVLYVSFCIKIFIDAAFLVFWAILVFIIHNKILPMLGLAGIPGATIEVVAVLFDIGTGVLCVIFIYADIRDEYYEYIKKK